MAHKNQNRSVMWVSGSMCDDEGFNLREQTRILVGHGEHGHYVVITGRGNELDTPMMAGCRVSGPAAVTSSGHTLERAESERAAWPAGAVSCLLIAVPPVPHPWPGHPAPGQAAITMCAKPSSSLPGTRGSVALRSPHSEDVKQWALLVMYQPSRLIAIRISLLDVADCYNFPCVSNIQPGTWTELIFPDITQNLLLLAVRHKTWTCLEWEIHLSILMMYENFTHIVTHTNIVWLRVGPTLHHGVSCYFSSWSKQDPQHQPVLGSGAWLGNV